MRQITIKFSNVGECPVWCFETLECGHINSIGECGQSGAMGEPPGNCPCEHVPKALSGSGQNSVALSNYEICVSCMDQPAMMCLSCAKKSALPSGETNTTKVQICPKCEDGVIRVGRSQDYDTAICWWCNGSGKL